MTTPVSHMPTLSFNPCWIIIMPWKALISMVANIGIFNNSNYLGK